MPGAETLPHTHTGTSSPPLGIAAPTVAAQSVPHERIYGLPSHDMPTSTTHTGSPKVYNTQLLGDHRQHAPSDRRVHVRVLRMSIELLRHATAYAVTAIPVSGTRKGLVFLLSGQVLYIIDVAMVEWNRK